MVNKKGMTLVLLSLASNLAHTGDGTIGANSPYHTVSTFAWSLSAGLELLSTSHV